MNTVRDLVQQAAVYRSGPGRHRGRPALEVDLRADDRPGAGIWAVITPGLAPARPEPRSTGGR